MRVQNLSFIATFNNVATSNLVDLSPFKDVLRPWCKNCEDAIPDFEEVNRQGAKEFGNYITNKVAENGG